MILFAICRQYFQIRLQPKGIWQRKMHANGLTSAYVCACMCERWNRSRRQPTERRKKKKTTILWNIYTTSHCVKIQFWKNFDDVDIQTDGSQYRATDQKSSQLMKSNDEKPFFLLSFRVVSISLHAIFRPKANFATN